MHKPQQQVRDFHKAFDFPTSPAEPQIRMGELRAALILEEAFETACAFVGVVRAQSIMHAQMVAVLQEKAKRKDSGAPDLLGAIDGICDTVVVCLGSAETIGVDIEPFYDEVMAANMRKIGGPVRADGKRGKPEGWRGPDLQVILDHVRNK